MPDKPRVLWIAEAANPQWQSVPLVGWSHYHALAKLNDGHLVTQVRNRDAILGAGLEEGVDFTAIDSERVERPVHRFGQLIRGGAGKGWTTIAALSSVTYYYFEHLVWKQFGGRIKAGEFDVVHRLTPLSPTTSSILARRCHKAGVPFVLGPLNGGLPWPPGYEKVRVAEREWLSYVRQAYRLMPAYQSTRKYSSAIIIGSMETWRQMPAAYHDRCIYVPENAIDPDRFPSAPNARRSEVPSPIRLLFLGRLVPYKGAEVALSAAAPFLRDGTMTFDVIGDGPQRPELEELVRREGIESAVTFHGHVDHARVSSLLGESDMLVFPSIREFGGAVVLESMAMGVVPMIVDYGGPAELATPGTGFLVPMADREGLIRSYRELLGKVAADPTLLTSRRGPAVDRARNRFTWDAKAALVTEVYRWLTGERPDKPDYAMPLPDDPVADPVAGR